MPRFRIGALRVCYGPSSNLVLELQLTAAYGPTNATSRRVLRTAADVRLVILDRKTHYVLWALTESIEQAFLQKTHDHNFDEASYRSHPRFEETRDRITAATP